MTFSRFSVEPIVPTFQANKLPVVPASSRCSGIGMRFRNAGVQEVWGSALPDVCTLRLAPA
ncbi:hypothetical protein T01_4873 [Trichinella spiralis]|uniref:Uncharacterized protein n=1 Tax=Trichinella spiralis TaxID=6334 RepID=A0A0V0ZGQ6_TRISP|nr:hypothetical protein T01_4873 [Trichinella spiralis]